jgi:predicted nucleic acid-binding protein
MTNFSLDTNILLRMSDGKAATHLLAGEAVSKLLARGDEVYITPQNLIEFWAVATRPLDANGLGWTTQRTMIEVEQLRNRFPLLQDSPEILTHWLTLVATHDIKGKKVHDARLVAVMQTHGVTHLLTFNTDDFRGYPNITLIHPNDVQ